MSGRPRLRNTSQEGAWMSSLCPTRIPSFLGSEWVHLQSPAWGGFFRIRGTKSTFCLKFLGFLVVSGIGYYNPEIIVQLCFQASILPWECGETHGIWSTRFRPRRVFSQGWLQFPGQLCPELRMVFASLNGWEAIERVLFLWHVQVMYIQASVSGVRKESSTGRQLSLPLPKWCPWLLSSDSTELSSPLREARKAEKTHSWPLFRKSLLIPALGTKDLGGVSFFFFLLFLFF